MSIIACSVLVAPHTARAQMFFGNETAPVVSFGNNITVEGMGYLSGAPGLVNPNNVTTQNITIENDGRVISTNGDIAYSDAVVNTGTIVTLSNSGTIIGYTAGVYNKGGAIDTLSNSSTIFANDIAVNNTGSIGALNNEAGGTISANGTEAIYAGGTIGSLYNAGTIISIYTAVRNVGNIGTVTNTGLIAATNTNGTNSAFFGGGTIGAVFNEGTIYSGLAAGFDMQNGGSIGLLDNTGTIIAGHTGVYLESGANIGTLTNSGLIQGDDYYGVNVQGGSAVGTLTNAAGGIISAGNDNLTTNGTTEAGIYNGGAITKLSNSGLITITVTDTSNSGGQAGILNSGTITSLGNQGTISGNFGVTYNYAVQAGIGNEGAIGTLTNSGLITITASNFENGNNHGSPTEAGIVNFGNIQALSNTGTISADFSALYNVGAQAGVFNAGSVGTLTNGGDINVAVSDTFDSGQLAGVLTTDVIGTLTNTGTIALSGNIFSANHPIAAVYNSGTIGTLNNSGLISDTTSYSDSSRNIAGVMNTGAIGAFNNLEGGTIFGAQTGVANYGTISALSNSGTIAGGKYQGIYNSGTIGAVRNYAGGTISGNSAGLENQNIIGTLSNSGVIQATGGDAIDNTGINNSGTITSLVNTATGTIAGTQTGVTNFGQIQSLTNNGTIFGAASSGIQNKGLINTLTNSGLIIGGSSGVNNYGGSILQLTNSGSIFGDAEAGIFNANFDGTSGYIGTLSNSGVIFGSYIGIANVVSSNSNVTPTISVLSNSGTIVGNFAAIASDGLINTITNLSGGTITGTFAGVANIGESSPSLSISVAGTIGTLTNSGTISGGIEGVFNSAIINTIYNAGLIEGTGTEGLGGPLIGGYDPFEKGDGVGIANGGLFIDAFDSAQNVYIDAVTNAGSILGGDIGVGNSSEIVREGSSTVFSAIGTIGVLSNSGTIFGGVTGVFNTGVIGTISNTGTIAGNDYGLNNSFGGFLTGGSETALYSSAGTIGALINKGSISGGDVGVINQSSVQQYFEQGGGTSYATAGTIGTLTNSGVITGGSTGVLNTGVIDTLTNTGKITGIDRVGVGNYNYYLSYVSSFSNSEASFSGIGTINVLTNSGTIAGGDTGIYNDGFIGTLTNSGLITGGYVGIYNDADNFGLKAVRANVFSSDFASGTIGTLTNTGTIAGGDTGIYNAGTIGTLTSSGTISGDSFGVNNISTIGIIYNSGLITGSISNFEPLVIPAIEESSIDGIGVANGPLYAESSVNSTNSYIGNLTNTGSITGAITGVGNFASELYRYYNSSTSSAAATIGTLSNSGTIYGGNDGIYNSGLIGTLSNTGSKAVISGGAYGIFNDAYGYRNNYSSTAVISGVGTIGALSNSGIISGGSTGIYNAGTIGTLTNSGTISGAIDTGIYNRGYIGTLSNTGLISGSYGGIGNDDEAYIGALTNQGTIISNGEALYNYGQIDTITNTGLISGRYTGIYNSGDLGTLSNTGTIKGETGIVMFSSGSTIYNAGTIASTNGGDAIALYGNNSLILDTGSDLIGTIYGGGSGSTITLEGTDAMSNSFADFGEGSSITVDEGADWEATGSWTIANAYNYGTFQPGTVGTPLTSTGNFTQGADGNYVVVVTPRTSSEFLIQGVANLAGNVTYELLPGIYGPHVYEYLQAAGGVVNQFTSATYENIPANDAITTYYTDPSANLQIDAPFTVGNVDPSVFSDQTQALAGATQDATLQILDKADEGGADANPGCSAESPAALADTSVNGVANSSRIASTLANVFCGEGGWVEATGSLSHADASGGASAYDANTAGFLAGVDKPIGPSGTRLGLAVGFDQTNLNDKSGGSGSMGTTRLALYGSQPLGTFTLAGVIGYGFASNSTSRDSGFGDLGENNSLGIFSAGVQGSTHVPLGTVDLSPAAGLRVASVSSTNFSENPGGFAGNFAVAGKTATYTSVQPYVSARLSESFITGSNITISPDALLGFEYEADDRGVATDIDFSGGSDYQTPHSNLDAADALVEAGVSAARNNWSLYAKYTAHISGNWDVQIGEAGFRLKF